MVDELKTLSICGYEAIGEAFTAVNHRDVYIYIHLHVIGISSSSTVNSTDNSKFIASSGQCNPEYIVSTFYCSTWTLGHPI